MDRRTFSQMKKNYRQAKKIACENLSSIFKTEEGALLLKDLRALSYERAARDDWDKLEIRTISTYSKVVPGMCETRLTLNLDNFAEEKMNDLVCIRMRLSDTSFNGDHPYGKEFQTIRLQHYNASLHPLYEHLKMFRFHEGTISELMRIARDEPLVHHHSFTEDIRYCELKTA